MEHLNMKQAQSPPPKAYALHAPPHCTVQCPCPLQSALLQAVTFLSPGCHGVQTGGTQHQELRHRALINTHQNYTHDISNQQYEVTVAKLAQASCTTPLKERGALHSDCPYDCP